MQTVGRYLKCYSHMLKILLLYLCLQLPEIFSSNSIKMLCGYINIISFADYLKIKFEMEQ